MAPKNVGRRSVRPKQRLVDEGRELPPEVLPPPPEAVKDPFLIQATASGPLRSPGLQPFPVPRFSRGYVIWPAVAPELIGGRRLKAKEIVLMPGDFADGSTSGFPRRVHRDGVPWTLSGIAVDAATAQKIMAAESSKGFRVGLAQVGDSSFGIYRNLLGGQ